MLCAIHSCAPMSILGQEGIISTLIRQLKQLPLFLCLNPHVHNHFHIINLFKSAVHVLILCANPHLIYYQNLIGCTI